MRRVASTVAVTTLAGSLRSNLSVTTSTMAAAASVASSVSSSVSSSVTLTIARSRSSPSLGSLLSHNQQRTSATMSHHKSHAMSHTNTNQHHGSHATHHQNNNNRPTKTSRISMNTHRQLQQQRRMLAAAAVRRRDPIPDGCLHRPVRRVVILSKVTLIDEVSRGTLNGVSEGQLATLKMMALDKDAHCVEARREHLDTVQAVEQCLSEYPGTLIHT
jgi:hypothetical protein